MKDITSSIFTFEDLIQGNFLYVDKTEYIWQLVRPAKEMYFLSRPRRFGKSLTLSTLKAVFEGKKELFKGLAIYDKPYDWKTHPVIHLDMNGWDFRTLDSMEDSFRLILLEQAKFNKVTLKEHTANAMFHELISTLHDTKGDVVILLDEYDKPILNNISKPDCHDFLAALKVFYSVIKEKNAMIRLAFITGVSKFCHVSLFSDLNNLTDLTMDARFATMLGYTQEEVESNFGDRIAALADERGIDAFKEDIREWYNGYRFEESARTVYNPVSLAQFFKSGGKFDNYWFQTGTPTFLLDLIMKSKFDFSVSLDRPVSKSFFDAFEVTDLDPMVDAFPDRLSDHRPRGATAGPLHKKGHHGILSAFSESGGGRVLQRRSAHLLHQCQEAGYSGTDAESGHGGGNRRRRWLYETIPVHLRWNPVHDSREGRALLSDCLLRCLRPAEVDGPGGSLHWRRTHRHDGRGRRMDLRH
ncbi:MAG: AAA family ATPase [Victivallales bacterium]|nr:AAA family ATPase [Victivallales bacterium]